MLRCIYADYTPSMAGKGARFFASRTPYFSEVRRLGASASEQKALLAKWEAQRHEEMHLLAERSKSINHTLGAWNRALGFKEGSTSESQLQARLDTSPAVPKS